MCNLNENEELNKALNEVSRLEEMMLEYLQEIADLKTENRMLREKLSGKALTEHEKMLLRVAKEIVIELEKYNEER